MGSSENPGVVKSPPSNNCCETHTDPPIVDAHFHIYTKELPLAANAWHHPTADASVERAIETLDSNGVTFGVIAPTSMHSTYNDYIRAALFKYKRLRSTAIVSPDIDIYQLQQMKTDGFVGIRFPWKMLDRSPDIGSDEYRILLRRVADLNWHVHVMERSDRLSALICAIESAGPKIVIDHMSLPDPTLGLNDPGFTAVLAAVGRGRTWVKLSAGYRFEPPEGAIQFAEELVRTAGGERLVWGSDWPFVGFENDVRYSDTISALTKWVPGSAIRRMITGRTPLELYFT